MTTLQLPTRQDAERFGYSITLDGASYGLDFEWNGRAGAWFLSILTDDGTPLVSGRKIVIGLPLGVRFRDRRLPPGKFVAVDRDGTGIDPGRYDLGARVLLTYTEAAAP